MSNFSDNTYYTTPLVLSVMCRVANKIGVDLHDNEVAEKLYWICCDLEDWPEGEGFGSSDHYSYIKKAEEEFA